MSKTPRCRQMLRGELWLVRCGGRFRISARELSAGARAGEATVASVRKPAPASHSRRSSGASQREQRCLTCSSVRRSGWCVSCVCKWPASCFQKRRAPVGDWGIYLSGRATKCVLPINQGCGLNAVTCNILHAGSNKQAKAASGAGVCVCACFSFLPRCPKLKTHVAQLPASCFACSFCCLHDSSNLNL